MDLLKANLVLSMLGAATGVCFPIGLSYILLYLGFGYGKTPSTCKYISEGLPVRIGAVETFIIGAALSATSLGKMID